MERAAELGPPVGQTELFLLVVQSLQAHPAFAELGAAVAAKATAEGLLPQRHDVHGAEHTLSPGELQQRYSHLPPNTLQLLLSQLLERRRAEAPQPAARGLTSLLGTGELSVLSGAVASAAASDSSPRPPAWLRPGRTLPSEPHRLLLLRQAGLLRSGQHPATVQPPEAYARQLTHALTVRGHRYAVYCLSYDKTGRYLITGSDDRLVKIWSTRTGLLQASCRGHDAEITDLAVSADNCLVASSSMDGAVRVWQLEGGEGRPGLPVSVLVGHAGPTAFVDFHPAHPDALLSASFDGTCRIWRARDASWPPIVLHVDPARFGLSGHAVTRLGGLGWPAFAGAPSAAVVATGGGLEVGPGVRTTRNMERQLLGLLGSQQGQAGTAGPSGSQQQAGVGARHSGRATRQLRELLEEGEDGAADGEEEQGEVEEAEEHQEEGGDGDGAQDGTTGLLVCGFSRDGTHIVAGGNDCSVYIWQWELPLPAQQAPQQAQQAQQAAPSPPAGATAAGEPAQESPTPTASNSAAAAAASIAAAAGERVQDVQQPPNTTAQQAAGAAALDDAPWPVPREVCQLKGHRNDVILLQFSHAGDRVATGSKDGSVRVWRRPRRWRKRPQAWEQEVTFAVLPDPEAIKEARRRRRPPPAPSVDQIAWSADDQRLCVSITDYGIRILAMPSGKLLHTLNLHNNHVHILECHPTDPALAFSASYDGTVALWHTRSGAVLRRFSSRHTRPDGRSWPDLIPFSDGHFSNDGRSITVTDVAGQLHFFALGPSCPLLARAPYDQFLSTDYSPLLRDLASNVLDAETQLPPHILTGREALCDALGNPYVESLQVAYRAQRVLSAPPQEVAWVEAGKEPGYLLAAPTLTAAAWAVEQIAGTEHAVQLAISRAQDRLTVYEDRLNAGASAAVAREAAAEAGRPPQRIRHRGERAWAAVEEAGEGDVIDVASSGEEYSGSRGGADSDEDVDSAQLTSEDDEEEDYEEQEGGERGGGRRGRRNAAVEPSRQSSRLAGQGAAARGRAAGGEATTQRRARPSGRRGGAARAPAGAAARAAAAAAHEEEEEEQEPREGRQRADREARAARRQEGQHAQLAQERHRRQRQAAARRRRVEADSSDGEDVEISEASDEEAAGSSRQPAAPRGSRRRGRDEMEGGGHQAAAAAASGGAHEEAGARQRKRARRSQGGWRALFNYSWLSGSEQTPGVYVPQAGDSVVYLRQGHEQFLTSTNDKRPPPWLMLRQGRSMRPAEPCTVVDVQYVIANDGTDHTLAQLTLTLSDQASPLKDTCFVVEVPPPVAGHAEFVVHRSRFQASVVDQCWEVDQQCQVYWNDDEATGAGCWWVGAIVKDQRGGRHADVLADPFGAGELWDRFEVEWRGVVEADGEVRDKQADNSMHCPWEMYTPGTTHQAALREAPCMDPSLTQRMVAAVEAASREDRFVIFVAAPEYDEMYVSKSRRSQYYNRLVALPLALDTLASRLRRGYYRQPEALACDIATVASNAAAFNGEDSEIAEDGAALARFLTAVLRGEDPELAAYATYPEDAAAAGEGEAEAGSRGRGRRARPQRRPQWAAEEEEEGGEEDAEQQQQQQQQQQQATGLPMELPPLPLLGSLPPLPLPFPLAETAPGQGDQQAQQQQQPWLSGLPSSTSPGGPMPVGFAGQGPGRTGSGGGMRVRFKVPQHMRAAAAGSAEHGAAGTFESGAVAGSGVQQSVTAAAAAAVASGLQEGGVAAAPAVAQPPPTQVLVTEAAGQLADGGAPAGQLAALFADVAAELSGPIAGAPVALNAATAAGALGEGVGAAAVAGASPFVAAAQPAVLPSPAWFAQQGDGWVDGSAGQQLPAAAQLTPGSAHWQHLQQQQQQQQEACGSGQHTVHASGGSARQRVAKHAKQAVSEDDDYVAEEEEEEEEAGSSSGSEQGTGRAGQRRGAGARSAARQQQQQQQQRGRRTTGRARQKRSYRESEGEEEEDGEEKAGQGEWAPASAPAQQQQQPRAVRARPKRQSRKQQESDGDWMDEDGSDGEEEEQADSSGSEGGGFGGRRQRDSGRRRTRR